MTARPVQMMLRAVASAEVKLISQALWVLGATVPDVVELAIEASGLTKRYKKIVALGGVDLAVPRGTVLGLLGPNGAGKTTAVRVLTTLLKPDGGSARVAGVDVTSDPAGVRSRIGLSGQYAAVDEYLTGYENLEMVGRLYHLGRRRSQQRARELLAQFGLEDAASRPAKTYSGGMRRRLDLAGALVADPEVIFLDEPTTGLDPKARNDMWDVISALVAGGTTLLLTTQYLEEADRLADEIVVIDHGLAIARGTARELKAQLGGERIELTLSRPDQLDPAAAVLAEVSSGPVGVDPGSHSLIAPVQGGAGDLTTALLRLAQETVEIEDVGLRRPTLDEVFLTLTGQTGQSSPDHPDNPVPRRAKRAEQEEEPV